MKDPRSIEAMEEALSTAINVDRFCYPGDHEVTFIDMNGSVIAIFDLRDCVKWKRLESKGFKLGEK